MNVDPEKEQLDKEWCSASELAQLGFCERYVQLERKLGKRASPARQAERRRGLEAHARFHSEGLPRAQAKRWCFVASVAFGEEAPETQLLRAFRDSCLRPYRAGRLCVRWYYRHSPRLCKLVDGKPAVLAATRLALRPVVWLATLVLLTRRRG